MYHNCVTCNEKQPCGTYRKGFGGYVGCPKDFKINDDADVKISTVIGGQQFLTTITRREFINLLALKLSIENGNTGANNTVDYAKDFKDFLNS